LRTLVELWRPIWQQDYDAFIQRDSARALLAAAVTATKELQGSPKYRDSEIDWDSEVHALPQESDDELASI
jgi:hypothetical protein